MVGFVSLYGNTNIPEFTPISITPTLGPPAYWRPSPGSANWDGATAAWSLTSGAQAGSTTSVSTFVATFDDTGLAMGSTVTVLGSQLASGMTVSNSAGTYTFSGTGSIGVPQLNKTGAGEMLLNTTLQGTSVIVSAGTLGGNGSILNGSLTVGTTAGGATLIPGATLAGGGELTIGGNVNFSNSGTYVWTLDSLTDSTSGGIAGTNWSLLNLAGGGGFINFGGSAQLALSFAGTAMSPSAGNSFWNSNHTWVIATSGASSFIDAPVVGGAILSSSYAGVGNFTLAGDTSNDLVLKFTSVNNPVLNLLWSANGTTALADGSGTITTAGKWTDGTTAGLTFNSNSPDNATFGNPNGSGGTASVWVPNSGVTIGSLTFNGSNAAAYTLTGNTATSSEYGGVIQINDGITALQSAYLGNRASGAKSGISKILLGYSQTWNVASGTLEVTAWNNGNGGIVQATVSSLTTTGSGTLLLNCPAHYSGGTFINGGVFSVNGASWLPSGGAITIGGGGVLELNSNNQSIGASPATVPSTSVLAIPLPASSSSVTPRTRPSAVRSPEQTVNSFTRARGPSSSRARAHLPAASSWRSLTAPASCRRPATRAWAIQPTRSSLKPTARSALSIPSPAAELSPSEPAAPTVQVSTSLAPAPC